MKNRDLAIVVNRYKEPIEWVLDFQQTHETFIYDKGNNKDLIEKFDNYEHLPNVGRDNHCVVYHIVKYYNELHESTIFSCNYPFNQIQFKELVSLGWDVPLEGEFWMPQENKMIEYKRYVQIPNEYVTYGAGWGGFPDYCGAHNVEQFKEIYMILFGEEMPPYFSDYPAGGAFMIRKHLITMRSLNFWEMLLRITEKYSDSAWALERFWDKIFNPNIKVTQ